MSQYDTVVIGAGIIGSCRAFELARLAYTLICVDSHDHVQQSLITE